MPGFEYNGDSGPDITATGVTRNGEVRIEITSAGTPASGSSGGSNGGGGTGGNSGPAVQNLVMYNGQMGYWENRLVSSNAEHDHYQKVFVKVGPSEAEKAAAAAKALQEKQQADAAAKAFAAQVAAAAAAAEQQRQQAIDAATIAGQHQSVSDAQKELDKATAESVRLKAVYDAAMADVSAKQQSAPQLESAAVAAESAYTNLRNNIRGMTLRNGYYGTFSYDLVGSNREYDLYANRFHSSGITPARVEAARVDALNKRQAVNNLPAVITAAQQVSLQAAGNYTHAETARLAAEAALKAAQQAEVQAAEAQRQRQAAEAAALAAAEQQRLADEAAKAAEAARIAAEQEKARQARQAAADKLKSTDIQSVRGIPVSAPASAFPLAWSVASGGGISLGSDVAAAVWSQISAASAGLRGLMAASMVGPFAATIVGLVFPSTAGDHSDSVVPGRDISALMPGDALGLPDAMALNHAADAKTTVSMPVRGRMVLRSDGTLETQLVRTPVAGNVPVVRGVLDAETGYWSYALPAMQGVPGQTILVSPSDAPGVNGPLGLTGPVPLPENIVHTGGQNLAPQGVTTTITPVADDLDFNDLILIFPPEALLKPLYVMLRNPRNMPGTADGKGQPVGDNWLGGAGTGDGAPIPSQIADKLRGREFGSFDAFRKAFWKAVAADPELSKQFDSYNLNTMKNGRAPFVPEREIAGSREKHELHHTQPISQGGQVYDVDNLRVLTPKRHIETHKGN